MGYANRIIEYAHKIGKNTADFTVNDLCKFMKEWMRIPTAEEVKKMTPTQREAYNKDVAAMKQWREKEAMSKNSNKYNNAMTSRLSSDQVVDVEQADEGEVEVNVNEVVCSMELTMVDVSALLWAFNEIFENYDLTNTPYEEPLKSLQEGLKGVE